MFTYTENAYLFKSTSNFIKVIAAFLFYRHLCHPFHRFPRKLQNIYNFSLSEPGRALTLVNILGI